jgi:hypothetical protein
VTGDLACRVRGRPPTDHLRVLARVEVLRALDPQMSIRQLAVRCRVGRPAIRLALDRLDEAQGWVCKTQKDLRAAVGGGRGGGGA